MVSGLCISISITILGIIILSSLTSIENGFFKPALAHSIAIPVRGAAPYGIAYNTANNNMYVANVGSSTVSVISDTSDSVIATILVGRAPISIAYSPPNNKLYVTNLLSDDVYVINGATNKVIKNIPVGDTPFGIAFSPSNNNVYVVNNGDDTISVINTSTDSVIGTILLDSLLPPPSNVSPVFLTYDRTNVGIYVGGIPQVSIVNTATNADVKEMRLPPPILDSETTAGLAHNTNNNRIYVTAFDSGLVFRISPDTNDFEGSAIPVGAGPIGIIHNPNNNRMYVTNSGSDIVSIINPTTNSVVGTIPTGSTPAGIAHNPSNNHIYVTNLGSNTVSVIHP